MNDQFTKDSLLPDEKIVATAKFHPLKIWSASVIAFFIWTLVVLLVSESDIISQIFVIGILLALLSYFFMRWLCKYDEFVITNKRVIAKVGVIRRHAFELHNEQVESIEVSQGIIGRLLNYGTLMPCGVGASKVRVHFVVNPFEFRQNFYNIKEESKAKH